MWCDFAVVNTQLLHFSSEFTLMLGKKIHITKLSWPFELSMCKIWTANCSGVILIQISNKIQNITWQDNVFLSKNSPLGQTTVVISYPSSTSLERIVSMVKNKIKIAKICFILLMILLYYISKWCSFWLLF